MADQKVSDLTALAASALAAGDLRTLVDVSDTTMAASGTNKKITVVNDLAGERLLLVNQSVTSQTSFTADAYLVGSNVAFPSGYPIVGTAYRLVFDVTKTAAGTATPIITIRTGTNASTADTARLTFTWGAGTAAADRAFIEVLAVFRTVGASTSAVLQGIARATTNLTTTGWSNAVKELSVTSSGFDSTTASLVIGASYNGGTSAAHTVQLVRSELIL